MPSPPQVAVGITQEAAAVTTTATNRECRDHDRRDDEYPHARIYFVTVAGPTSAIQPRRITDLHRAPTAVAQASPLLSTLAIAVIVFQLRVVTGTPKSRSSVPR